MADAIFFASQDEFGTWLAQNRDANEVWVGYFKKATGRKSLTWSNSVDVALCHGWIDGLRKSINEHSYRIRFTPRKPDSRWSVINVRKAASLIQQGKMQAAGLKLYNERKAGQGYSSRDRLVPLAPQFLNQLRSNRTAWQFFTTLAPSYKRDSIWWVMSAKKIATQQKRLGILISSSAAREKIPGLRR